MNYPAIATEAALLEDLLEASAALYHRNVAIIQRAFAEQYFQTLGERRAADPSFGAEQMATYRRALKAKQDELIAAQQALLVGRNANIRSFVASRAAAPAAAA
jgi:hypothetical protein